MKEVKVAAEYYVNSQHMLIGPGVRHELIVPEATTQPEIYPWSIILHSQSGPQKTRWENLRNYMLRRDIGLECHFIVDMDGLIIQTMPLNRRADCNFRANRFQVPFWASPTGQLDVGAISFETQDEGAASLPFTPWTLPQANAIANACAAIGHKYGIPYTQPATWNDRGIGHHSLFPEWSSFRGKTCPGRARIHQMDWVRQRAASICACAPEGV
ncbi:MAG: N-acetylmuramoyl-L-alanine amidase [Planctomycetota bacterium]|jgi:N-acetyl-anhydromuramyl-L-alanine amidase AmpD